MPKSGPRTTYRYSDRFKAIAVRLSQMAGVSVQDVAQSLYIFDSDRQLRRVVGGHVYFHSEERLHSSLGYGTPNEFERQCS